MSLIQYLLTLPRTDWRFVDSTGVDVSAGPFLTVGASGGLLYVENRTTRNTVRLAYGALGLGVAVGFIPVDLTVGWITVPIGHIHKGGMSLAAEDLTPESFEGFCTIISFGVSKVVAMGAGLSLILMGQDFLPQLVSSAGALALTVPFGPLAAPLGGFASMIASSRAIGALFGVTARLPDFGADMMVYRGRMGILV